MPFVARCYRCGYVITALTKDGLNIYKDAHESKSHNDYGTEWTTTPISHQIFYQLERMMKLPAFWKAVRSSPKRLATLFSG